MSSANVYRFFPSKQALVEEVCQSLLAELLRVARAAVDSPGKPSERIAAMLVTLHRLMRDQLTAGTRAYEIVEVAVEQKWPPIVDYLHQCAAMLAEAIADGQAAGEFGPGDPLHLGWMTLQSCVVIHDPTLIPSCTIIRPDAKPEEAIDFALRALANLRPPAPIPET